MQRINTATRAQNLFGAGKDGFTNGDPSLGVPATQLDAALMNALQEEIATVVEAAGLTLDGADFTQLLEAIAAMIAASIPSVPIDFLAKANNLSDLQSLSTALTNLGFATSQGASGYQKLPGGTIIQWGTGQTAAGGGAITFPLTFPSACRAVIVNDLTVAAPTNYIGSSTPTQTGFSVWNNSNNAGTGISYIAIGS